MVVRFDSIVNRERESSGAKPGCVQDELAKTSSSGIVWFVQEVLDGDGAKWTPSVGEGGTWRDFLLDRLNMGSAGDVSRVGLGIYRMH